MMAAKVPAHLAVSCARADGQYRDPWEEWEGPSSRAATAMSGGFFPRPFSYQHKHQQQERRHGRDFWT